MEVLVNSFVGLTRVLANFVYKMLLSAVVAALYEVRFLCRLAALPTWGRLRRFLYIPVNGTKKK